MIFILKDEVLSELEKNRGREVSGETLSKRFSVSRNAVWKAVSSLRKEGYTITAATNRGYTLSENNDIVSSAGIAGYLENKDISVEVYPLLDSTNILLKKYAEDGVPEGKVVIAEQQTAGRGRLGRSFSSPRSSGLYMSVLLRPSLSAENSLFITAAAAVAVTEAINSLTGISAGIKWVNDVYVGGKKVCGILTEGAVDMETGGFSYAVLGIGINVTAPEGGLPAEIRDVAGYLFESGCTPADFRNRLAATVINNFITLYHKLPDKSFINEYRKLSVLIGKRVNIISCGKVMGQAGVVGIDENAGLIVRYDDGTAEILTSGEVSVRLSEN